MTEEKKFDKYEKKGPGFHYEELNPRRLAIYNTYNRAKFNRTCDLIGKLLSAEAQNSRLIDIGCGDGVLLWHLQAGLRGLDCVGLDPEESALALAKTKVPDARFIRGTAYETGEPNQGYDLAVSTDVIEHLAEPERMLMEMKRILKPGGKVLVGTPIRLTKTPRDHNHVQEFFPEDLLVIFDKHFVETELVLSHDLFWSAVYTRPAWHKFRWKYLIDILDIYFRYNVFLREKPFKNSYYTYAFVSGKKS